MNDQRLAEICAKFALGIPTILPTRVHGGLLHHMWRVSTDKAIYAVKQLSTKIDLTDANIINGYNLSEGVAADFIALGIPGISAIAVDQLSGKEKEYLAIVNGTGFLVYPWIESNALESDKVSAKHTLQISAILAKMHHLNLDVPEILTPEFDIHHADKIIELIAKAKSSGCDFADELQKNTDILLAANADYQYAIPILNKNVVVSHGDLDQKNVLWDEYGKPLLIDWESVRKLNPVYEIVNASLDWSGITTNNFNQEMFVKMLDAYKMAGGSINAMYLESAFCGVLGNWINWLIYNIERSYISADAEQKAFGEQQVLQTLSTIIRLTIIIPDLIKIVAGRM